MSGDEASERKIERIRIVTRGYEVSSSGHISPSQFLRYLEHVRWRTIAHSRKVPARSFFRMGVVRAQHLDIFEDVSFDVELELSMWLARVGKTSMDFSHDVVRVEDGAIVARSTATIVALGPDRRPMAIDPAARPYVVTRNAASIERLDGGPPDDAFEQPIVVRPSDQDLQGHVNHARYADFVEDTRHLAALAGGYGPGSFGGPARSLSISYDEEARLGDPLRACTFVSKARPESVDFVLLKGEGRVAMRARVGLAPRGVRPEGIDPR